MDFILTLKLMVVSVIEGLTEFLPISSTGHMLIASDLLSIDSNKFLNLFVVVIQVGAIMAVVVLYRQKLLDTLKPKNLLPDKKGFKFWTKIMVAIIPAGLVGLAIDDIIEAKFMNTITVACALVGGAVLMIVCENKYRRKGKIKDIDDISYQQAFIIGAFQCLAIIFPGFSRSASSIIGGWIMGLKTVVAAEFSFFIAIPTMFLGSIYKMSKHKAAISIPEFIYIALGLVISFIVAYVVIEKFMNFLKKRPMRIFAVYRILIGLILILVWIF